MKADIETIELYLLQKLSKEDAAAVRQRKKTDVLFRTDLLAQTKVQLVALMYGRRTRMMKILAAGESAFSDQNFKKQIAAIFK